MGEGLAVYFMYFHSRAADRSFCRSLFIVPSADSGQLRSLLLQQYTLTPSRPL